MFAKTIKNNIMGTTNKELFEKIKMKEGKMKTELPRLEVIDEDCENEAMEDLWGRITQDFIVGKMSVDELHNKYFDEFLSHRQWEIEDEFSDIIKNLTKKN